MNAPLLLSALVPSRLRVGDAIAHRALTVFPILGADAPVEFISLERALPLDFALTEVPGGVVTALVAHNPTDHHVLLLDGQEVTGARQNRVFDGTFLVAPHTKRPVAVCCIERGRWEASRENETFESSAHFADPRVRTIQRATRARDRDGSLRSDQQAVWKTIDGILASERVLSPTASLVDVQASRAAEEPFPVTKFWPREAQVGLMAYLGPKLVSVEILGRADAYRDVHAQLVRGFSLLLSRFEGDVENVDVDRARADLDRLLSLPVALEAQDAETERVHGALGQGLSRGRTLLHWSTVAA